MIIAYGANYDETLAREWRAVQKLVKTRVKAQINLYLIQYPRSRPLHR